MKVGKARQNACRELITACQEANGRQNTALAKTAVESDTAISCISFVFCAMAIAQNTKLIQELLFQ